MGGSAAAGVVTLSGDCIPDTKPGGRSKSGHGPSGDVDFEDGEVAFWVGADEDSLVSGLLASEAKRNRGGMGNYVVVGEDEAVGSKHQARATHQALAGGGGIKRGDVN